MLKKKGVGFYFVILAAIAGLVGLIYFQIWAGGHNGSDMVVTVGLALGIVIDIVMIFFDSDYLAVAATACYAVGMVKVLTGNVGSFVDSLQGINMFGDASQVTTLIIMAVIDGVAVILMIIASFLTREKKEA